MAGENRAMTLIVGINYGSEILMIADTRVSTDEKYGIPPKDMLRKLVFIEFFQRRAVLGFSGNIGAIKKIIESINRKAKYFTSSGSLKDDIKKWIEEAIKMAHERHYLQFILCDFDPNDKTRIYIFDVKKTGKVQIRPQELVAVIGSGEKQLKHKLLETTLGNYGNPRGYNNYQAYSDVRALMVTSIIATEFENAKSKDVGGPFVVANIRPDKCIGPRYLWPSKGVDSSNIQETVDKEKTILYNPSTGERYTLFSIYKYSDADFSQFESARANLIPDAIG